MHPDDLPLAMARACQLTSCLASVLLAAVLFFLGRELFSPAIAFWGALLFQVLPGPGRLMADGLSEPVFLVFACGALIASIRGLSGKHPGWFAMAGLCGGLAYLTRPEGLIIPFACLIVLAIWRCREGKLAFAPRAALLLAPLILVAAPYIATIGKLTSKPSVDYAIDPGKWGREGIFKPVQPEKKAAVASRLPFAVWWFGPDVTPDMRWGWAFKAVAVSLGEGFLHAGWAFVLLAMWVHRRRFAESPGWGLILAVAAVLCLLCYRVAQSNGYLSARHVVLLTAVASFALVAGLEMIARRRWAATAAMVLVMAACLPKLLAPLHPDRAPFRAAGEWIARNALPGDGVWDPYAHAYYHAGRVFTEGRDGVPASEAATCYVILEESTNEHQHLFYLVRHSEILAKLGTEVQRFPLAGKKHKGSVVVYRVPVRLPPGAGVPG